jgi:hypothetical protein
MLKSIIDIDVQDAKFVRFQELFQKYVDALEKTPDVWKNVGELQTRTGRELAETGAEHATQLTRAEGLWSSMARNSRTVLGNVLSTAEGLLKWTGILGAVGGLLGVGAIGFGLDRLIGGVGRDRRTAMGLGMSIGGVRAFDVDFSRLLDTHAFLGSIGEMETDITKQAPAFALLGHGLSGNTQTDAISMLNAMRALAQRTPMAMLGSMFGAYGLNVDPATQRRLKSMSADEYNKQLAALRRDTKAFDIPDKVAEQWQNLITQLERAGMTIGAVLIKGLLPLEKPLEHLSEQFVKAVAAFLQSHNVEDAIKKFGAWLDNFATQTLPVIFSKFEDAITDAATVIHVLAHPLDTAAAKAGEWMQDIQNLTRWAGKGSITGDKQSYLTYLSGVASRFGVPEQMSAFQWQQESGSQFYPHANKGHVGPFQFDPETSKWLNKLMGTHYDPIDPREAGILANAYDAWLLRHYKGNMAMALAAYNAGWNKVDAAIEAAAQNQTHNWPAYLKPETQTYLANAKKAGIITINVSVPPGADVHITGAALAAAP